MLEGGEAVPKFASDSGFHKAVKRRVFSWLEQEGLSPRDCPRMYLKTAALLIWFGASYTGLVFFATVWWQAALCAGSLAFAIAGMAFAIQHDGNHRAFSESRSVNQLAGSVLDLLGGSSYVWKWKHNIAHHTYTNLARADGDIEVPFARLSPAQPRKKIHRYQKFYLWLIYGFLVIHWQLFEDFKQVAVGRISGQRFPRPRGLRLVKFIGGKGLFLVWAFVVPMLLHSWWLVLLFYAAISLVLSFILVLVFQLAHTVEETTAPVLAPGTTTIDKGWAVHQVETTANFAIGNGLLSWYLGGLNFQIEHHLFPRICHIHYPQIAKIVREACAEFGVRYSAHRTLLSALCSHYQWLHRMGQAAPTAGR